MKGFAHDDDTLRYDTPSATMTMVPFDPSTSSGQAKVRVTKLTTSADDDDG